MHVSSGRGVHGAPGQRMEREAQGIEQLDKHIPTTGPSRHTALIQKRIPSAYVVTGVSGSGKSTVGKLLAERLRAPFYDGDDFHPKHNIDKMRSGHSLTDEDREPWLRILAGLLEQHVKRKELAVLACSCLKLRYRDILCGADQGAGHADDIAFVLLQPPIEELQRRVAVRSKEGSHFMPAALLESQLAALEVSPDSQTFGSLPPSQIVDQLVVARHEA